MGLCRITFSSLLVAGNLFNMPDREAALDFVFLQGVWFSPLLESADEAVCIFDSAAASVQPVCLPVAEFCTDTSTGGRYKLKGALLTLSNTRLH